MVFFLSCHRITGSYVCLSDFFFFVRTSVALSAVDKEFNWSDLLVSVFIYLIFFMCVNVVKRFECV